MPICCSVLFGLRHFVWSCCVSPFSNTWNFACSFFGFGIAIAALGCRPLVLASLRASVSAGIPIKVWAVEKNANAVVTLRAMHHDLGWGDSVTIVASDMRKVRKYNCQCCNELCGIWYSGEHTTHPNTQGHVLVLLVGCLLVCVLQWEAPCKADVLVSELLGSFGDNELSPECLDGAQSFLHDEGISVPQNYTSFLAPIQSSKLWNEVAKFGESGKFETPFVVRMHQVCANVCCCCCRCCC